MSTLTFLNQLFGLPLVVGFSCWSTKTTHNKDPTKSTSVSTTVEKKKGYNPNVIPFLQ